MTTDDAQKALIAVLQDIQAMSGLPCPKLDGSSVPPKILEDFTSTIWPVAITEVARKLDVVIPPEVHIFGGEKGAKLLTIAESAELICKKSVAKVSTKVAA